MIADVTLGDWGGFLLGVASCGALALSVYQQYRIQRQSKRIATLERITAPSTDGVVLRRRDAEVQEHVDRALGRHDAQMLQGIQQGIQAQEPTLYGGQGAKDITVRYHHDEAES